MTLAELTAEFDELPDWEDRCDLLIDLGMELPDLPAEEKVEANRVHGCQSNVWLVLETTGTGDQQRIRIRAHSEAMIVNGLICVLLAIYDGKSPRELLEISPQAVFQRLDLDRHLSPQRKNGLSGMVQRIRARAAELLANQS